MSYFASVIGQMNIDFIFHEVQALPNPGEEVFARDFKISLGGGPMVIPYHLKKLGVNARFGTFIGDDFESQIARELLEKLNYQDVEYLSHPAERPIVVTSVLSTSSERSFIGYNRNVDESVLDPDLLMDFYGDCKVAYFPKNIEVANRLVESGCQLIMDVAWNPNLKLSDMASELKLVTFFTPNDKEAKHLCDESDLLVCLDKISEYVKTPIIKLGRNGCLVKSEDSYYLVTALPAVSAIDPTGAGDNFLAGLMFGMYLNLDLLDVIKVGNIVGGLSVEVLGCYQSNLDRESVITALASFPSVIQITDAHQLNDILNQE